MADIADGSLSRTVWDFASEFTELCPPVRISAAFPAGTLGSLLVLHFQSLWPGYLRHAVFDLCLLGIGAWLDFGAFA